MYQQNPPLTNNVRRGSKFLGNKSKYDWSWKMLKLLGINRCSMNVRLQCSISERETNGRLWFRAEAEVAEGKELKKYIFNGRFDLDNDHIFPSFIHVFIPLVLVGLLVCLLLLWGKCLQAGREIGRLETHLGCLHFKFWPLYSIVVKTNQVKSNWWNIQTKREWKSLSIKIFPDFL